MTRLYWLIHKDLLSELRTRQAWPTMLLLGSAVVFICTTQLSGSEFERRALVCGLLWLAILFSSVIALERSFDCEREDGCMDGLLSYPISPLLVYVSKVTVNILALMLMECVLVPLFAVLSGVPLLTNPGRLMVVLLLGNAGISGLGTLLSGLVCRGRGRSSLLSLLLLPLLMPVLLGGAEATRLAVIGEFSTEWLRWVQFLGAFAVIFVVAGITLFEFVVEE